MFSGEARGAEYSWRKSGKRSRNRVASLEILEERAVMAAPVGANGAAFVSSNATFTLDVADFGFSDPGDIPPHAFTAVKIATLPLRGTLTNNGVAVTAGQFIPVADIVAGDLQLTSSLAPADPRFTGFTFQVQDDGPVNNLDTVPRTFLLFVGDPQANFVTNLYLDVLLRVPDPAGLFSWVQTLNASVPRQSVALGIWESPEHRGLQVDGFYLQFLHRAAEPAGRQGWVNAMLGGMTEEDAMVAFMNTPEYLLHNPTNVSFVVGIYRDLLGRSPDSAGQTFWVNQLLTGALSTTGVARALVNSHERHLNVVQSYYVEFLNRQPDAAGLTFWVAQLDTGALDDEGVISSLLATPEYFSHFAP